MAEMQNADRTSSSRDQNTAQKVIPHISPCRVLRTAYSCLQRRQNSLYYIWIESIYQIFM